MIKLLLTHENVGQEEEQKPDDKPKAKPKAKDEPDAKKRPSLKPKEVFSNNCTLYI